MQSLGMPQVRGLKPSPNAQVRAITAAIDRYLSADQAAWEAPILPKPMPLAESPYVAPPERRPRMGSSPESLRRLVRKWDPVARDARNRALGKRGEAFVMEAEERRLFSAGRKDLIDAMRWVSERDGDGAGYDILSFDPKTGDRRLIEVKATCGAATMPFFLTRNEESKSRECPDEFRLYRVFDLSVQPRIFELRPPLTDAVRLETASWVARFS